MQGQNGHPPRDSQPSKHPAHNCRQAHRIAFDKVLNGSHAASGENPAAAEGGDAVEKDV
ncbi:MULTISPECIES: hypothetical protein [Paraburkholderia]|uniref:hypothetical protein n=1 Tax=Paraburkholderia TaxID=1822464 RepID=UPI0016558530|nr:hypothetical protein [Paraburkholderia podalyriae]